eukprot:3645483-Rhodomonas_salina.2
MAYGATRGETRSVAQRGGTELAYGAMRCFSTALAYGGMECADASWEKKVRRTHRDRQTDR